MKLVNEFFEAKSESIICYCVMLKKVIFKNTTDFLCEMSGIQLEERFAELMEIYMPEEDGRSDISIDGILEEKGDTRTYIKKSTITNEWEYGRFKEDMWRAYMLRAETTAWFQERDTRTPDFLVIKIFNGRKYVKRIKRATDIHYRRESSSRTIKHDMLDTRPEIPYLRRAPISLQTYVDMHRKMYVDPASSEVFFPDYMEVDKPRYTRRHSNEEPQTHARVRDVKRPYDLEPRKKVTIEFPVDSSRPNKKNWRVRKELERSWMSDVRPNPRVIKENSWTYHAPPGKLGKINIYH